jgi:hypothetical protein
LPKFGQVVLSLPKLILIDSITAINQTALGAIIVSGSHGGFSSTGFAANNPAVPLLVFFNDAGIGKDAAGIYCLAALDEKNIACACYGHMSARIGDAQDGYTNGVITHVNKHAEQLHLSPGMSVNGACAMVGFQPTA